MEVSRGASTLTTKLMIGFDIPLYTTWKVDGDRHSH